MHANPLRMVKFEPWQKAEQANPSDHFLEQNSGVWRLLEWDSDSLSTLFMGVNDTQWILVCTCTIFSWCALELACLLRATFIRYSFPWRIPYTISHYIRLYLSLFYYLSFSFVCIVFFWMNYVAVQRISDSIDLEFPLLRILCTLVLNAFFVLKILYSKKQSSESDSTKDNKQSEMEFGEIPKSISAQLNINEVGGLHWVFPALLEPECSCSSSTEDAYITCHSHNIEVTPEKNINQSNTYNINTKHHTNTLSNTSFEGEEDLNCSSAVNIPFAHDNASDPKNVSVFKHHFFNSNTLENNTNFNTINTKIDFNAINTKSLPLQASAQLQSISNSQQSIYDSAQPPTMKELWSLNTKSLLWILVHPLKSYKGSSASIKPGDVFRLGNVNIRFIDFVLPTVSVSNDLTSKSKIKIQNVNETTTPKNEVETRNKSLKGVKSRRYCSKTQKQASDGVIPANVGLTDFAHFNEIKADLKNFNSSLKLADEASSAVLQDEENLDLSIEVRKVKSKCSTSNQLRKITLIEDEVAVVGDIIDVQNCEFDHEFEMNSACNKHLMTISNNNILIKDSEIVEDGIYDPKPLSTINFNSASMIDDDKVINTVRIPNKSQLDFSGSSCSCSRCHVSLSTSSNSACSCDSCHQQLYSNKIVSNSNPGAESLDNELMSSSNSAIAHVDSSPHTAHAERFEDQNIWEVQQVESLYEKIANDIPHIISSIEKSIKSHDDNGISEEIKIQACNTISNCENEGNKKKNMENAEYYNSFNPLVPKRMNASSPEQEIHNSHSFCQIASKKETEKIIQSMMDTAERLKLFTLSLNQNMTDSSKIGNSSTSSRQSSSSIKVQNKKSKMANTTNKHKQSYSPSVEKSTSTRAGLLNSVLSASAIRAAIRKISQSAACGNEEYINNEQEFKRIISHNHQNGNHPNAYNHDYNNHTINSNSIPSSSDYDKSYVDACAWKTKESNLTSMVDAAVLLSLQSVQCVEAADNFLTAIISAEKDFSLHQQFQSEAVCSSEIDKAHQISTSADLGSHDDSPKSCKLLYMSHENAHHLLLDSRTHCVSFLRDSFTLIKATRILVGSILQSVSDLFVLNESAVVNFLRIESSFSELLNDDDPIIQSFFKLKKLNQTTARIGNTETCKNLISNQIGNDSYPNVDASFVHNSSSHVLPLEVARRDLSYLFKSQDTTFDVKSQYASSHASSTNNADSKRVISFSSKDEISSSLLIQFRIKLLVASLQIVDTLKLLEQSISSSPGARGPVLISRDRKPIQFSVGSDGTTKSKEISPSGFLVQDLCSHASLECLKRFGKTFLFDSSGRFLDSNVEAILTSIYKRGLSYKCINDGNSNNDNTSIKVEWPVRELRVNDPLIKTTPLLYRDVCRSRFQKNKNNSAQLSDSMPASTANMNNQSCLKCCSCWCRCARSPCASFFDSTGQLQLGGCNYLSKHVFFQAMSFVTAQWSMSERIFDTSSGLNPNVNNRILNFNKRLHLVSSAVQLPINSLFNDGNALSSGDDQISIPSQVKKSIAVSSSSWCVQRASLTPTASSCRICLCDEDDEDADVVNDPLISVCKCKGSMGAVHASCLRQWTSTRLNIVKSGNSATSSTTENSDSGVSSFFLPAAPLKCDLCKSPLPSAVSLPERIHLKEARSSALLPEDQQPDGSQLKKKCKRKRNRTCGKADSIMNDNNSNKRMKKDDLLHQPKIVSLMNIPKTAAPFLILQRLSYTPGPGLPVQNNSSENNINSVPEEENLPSFLRGTDRETIEAARLAGLIPQSLPSHQDSNTTEEASPLNEFKNEGYFFISFANKRQVTLGRGENADLQIKDSSLSRIHASLRLEEDDSTSNETDSHGVNILNKGGVLGGFKLILEDSKSRLGTYVASRTGFAIAPGETAFLHSGGEMIPVRAENTFDPVIPYGPQLYQRGSDGKLRQVPWLQLSTRRSRICAVVFSLICMMFYVILLGLALSGMKAIVSMTKNSINIGILQSRIQQQRFYKTKILSERPNFNELGNLQFSKNGGDSRHRRVHDPIEILKFKNERLPSFSSSLIHSGNDIVLHEDIIQASNSNYVKHHPSFLNRYETHNKLEEIEMHSDPNKITDSSQSYNFLNGIQNYRADSKTEFDSSNKDLFAMDNKHLKPNNITQHILTENQQQFIFNPRAKYQKINKNSNKDSNYNKKNKNNLFISVNSNGLLNEEDNYDGEDEVEDEKIDPLIEAGNSLQRNSLTFYFNSNDKQMTNLNSSYLNDEMSGSSLKDRLSRANEIRNSMRNKDDALLNAKNHKKMVILTNSGVVKEIF